MNENSTTDITHLTPEAEISSNRISQWWRRVKASLVGPPTPPLSEVSLFAETLQSPITVEPAAITEYRRRLMGKTPEEALAIYKKLIGSIWNSQCEPVRQIRNLSNADQILAAVTEAPLFPSRETFVNLEQYLHETYVELVKSGWSFSIKMVDSSVAQDQVIEALKQEYEDPYEASIWYFPPKSHRYQIPSISITTDQGANAQVFLTTNTTHFAEIAQATATDSSNPSVIHGINFNISAAIDMISSDFSQCNQTHALLRSISNLVHEVDHSVQRLQTQTNTSRSHELARIANSIVGEGSSITAQRIFLDNLGNTLINSANEKTKPAVTLAIRGLHTLLHARSPDDRTLYYGAGKLLFDLLPLNEAIQDGKMPRSSQEIEQIEAELVKNPKVIEALFSLFFHDGWSRWLAEAFPHNVPMMTIGADAATESFRAMIMRNADLLHYLKNKNLGTATHLRERFSELSDPQEKFTFLFETLGDCYKASKYGATFSQTQITAHQQYLAETNNIDALVFVCTQSMPANDFVLECWQHLQNPSSHHFRVVLDEFATKIKANFQS